MTEFTELIPGLPEELALECLTRLPYTAHRVSTQVSKKWRDLLQSRDFYYHRKQTGFTHKSACLIQALPPPARPIRIDSPNGDKRVGPPVYGVSMFDPVSQSWDRVDPVPKYPNGLPLFCQILSSEGKIVLMGGWDPVSYDSVKDVFVYEFTTRRWRQGRDMPGKRSFFAAGEINGRIIIAGGHDENKNALSSAWVYDVGRDEWTELTRMSQERDECEGVIIGSEFWVVSGYCTESQGSFQGSAELIELGTSQWKRVDDSWEGGVRKCPRSCVGVGKDGKLFCWAESDSAVRVGACAVEMGEWTFITGSAYQGAPQGFYVMNAYEGQNGKLKRLDVPDDFLGLVQSGCCVEL